MKPIAEPNLPKLIAWLRQGSWNEAARHLEPGLACASELECDGQTTVSDGGYELRVLRAPERIRRRGVRKGQLVAYAGLPGTELEHLIASEDGCYTIRPLRKPGPPPLPEALRRKARTVYFTDDEWVACGNASDEGASAYVRGLALVALADIGLL